MALTQVDYTAYRTMQEVLHRRLDAAQGPAYSIPRLITWDDVGVALDDAVEALETAGYRIVKA
jgi:hypothetical protein